MSRRAILIFCCVLSLVIGTAAWWASRPKFGAGSVDVAELGKFELDQVNGVDADIPERIRRLDGQRVILLGEMWEPMSRDGSDAGVAAFDLMRPAETYWGTPPPHVQRHVRCRVPAGRRVEYYPNTVQTIGVLHVGVMRDNGRISSVFRMDVESIQPAP
jgi:hypothetical protein